MTIGSANQAIRYALLLADGKEMRVFLEHWSVGAIPEWASYFEEFCEKHPDPKPPPDVTRERLAKMVGHDTSISEAPSIDHLLDTIDSQLAGTTSVVGRSAATWLKAAGFKKASFALNLNLDLFDATRGKP